MHGKRSEDESSIAKMDENRGRFLGMCFFPRHRDQMSVTKHSGQFLEVRVVREEDVGSVALWNMERDETYIMEWVDDAASDVRAMLTSIDRYEEQFVWYKFQMLVTVLNEEQCGIVLINDRKKFEFVQSSECTLRSCMSGIATEIRVT